MKKTTVTEAAGHPVDVVDDPLTDVLRSGAQRLLVEAIEAEAEAFLALMADRKLKDGRARFVRRRPATSRKRCPPCSGRMRRTCRYPGLQERSSEDPAWRARPSPRGARRGVVLGRLKDKWEVEYTAWQKRDLSGRRFVYVWADGVYLQARMESRAECMLAPRRTARRNFWSASREKA